MMRHVLIAIWVVWFAHNADASTPDQTIDPQTEVALRLIGHEVLLQAGDSTSLVKPVTKEGRRYTLTFDTDFGFDPGAMGQLIDSVVRRTHLSTNYIASFESCQTGQVVYSYQVSDSDALKPCLGRYQAKDCYHLVLSLLDDQPRSNLYATATLPGDQEHGQGRPLGLILLLLGLVGTAAWLAVMFSRRTSPPTKDGMALGRFIFQPLTMTLSIDGQRMELTGKEADLLQLLSRSSNKTLHRDRILREVWGDDGDYVGRTLDVFISKLRKRLAPDPNVRILNVRGVGYKLVVD